MKGLAFRLNHENQDREFALIYPTEKLIKLRDAGSDEAKRSALEELVENSSVIGIQNDKNEAVIKVAGNREKTGNAR